jgi:hypothetical protein
VRAHLCDSSIIPSFATMPSPAGTSPAFSLSMVLTHSLSHQASGARVEEEESIRLHHRTSIVDVRGCLPIVD